MTDESVLGSEIFLRELGAEDNRQGVDRLLSQALHQLPHVSRRLHALNFEVVDWRLTSSEEQLHEYGGGYLLHKLQKINFELVPPFGCLSQFPIYHIDHGGVLFVDVLEVEKWRHKLPHGFPLLPFGEGDGVVDDSLQAGRERLLLDVSVGVVKRVVLLNEFRRLDHERDGLSHVEQQDVVLVEDELVGV